MTFEIISLYDSVQWNKNAYFNLALTIAYFWVTLLVMFILYFFIYQVASSLEKRSKENAKKVSDIIGVSSATMTNLVMNMSKKHRLKHTPLSSTSSCPSKFHKKYPQQASISSLSRPHTSIDEEAGSSFVLHNRLSSGLDVLNRSSSNETSGELTSVASIVPNIATLLSITHVTAGSLKRLDENRILSAANSVRTSISTLSKSKTVQRQNTSKARKALRTITIIMGAFVICWTPVSPFFFR